MRLLWDFLVSLKTAFGLFVLPALLCLAGSLMLPRNLAFFSGIDDAPLLSWLSETGNLSATWWIYALIAAIAVLAISTIACTVEALMAIRSTKNLISRLSPQIMHIGVLCVLLAHLLTAWWGVREDVQIAKGQRGPAGEGIEVLVRDVRSEMDEEGYYTAWEAELELFVDGKTSGIRTLRPVEPVHVKGTGLFFKTLSVGEDGEEPWALIRVVRDPGALWAVTGGVLVVLGGAGFVWSRRSGISV